MQTDTVVVVACCSARFGTSKVEDHGCGGP